MQKIYVGSMNPAKIKSVETVFGHKYNVEGCNAPSHVSNQPMSDKETKQGAVQRATYLVEHKLVDIGIGLEGGVMTIEDQLYLCNWGALATKQGHIFVAAGARIPLPSFVQNRMNDGLELGEVMEVWTKKHNVRSNEGAIGVFTEGLLDRTTMFSQINSMLLGQLYHFNNKKTPPFSDVDVL
ncbi:DUF84 family protein [Salipaludibacillus daqingensis]|uniref:DUF84 family protein n=1 Tax=Salipaludibacillus daqingensis TaxID=3041001 RepID=UPI002475CDEC|nr:DUF84 family protein [Salipaludibacillus daqingensis]